jgi:hypothetical protein
MTLVNTACTLLEDGVLTPKHVRNNFNINLHYLFVHMLVYNKHLLFSIHCMNIKVIGFRNLKYIIYIALWWATTPLSHLSDWKCLGARLSGGPPVWGPACLGPACLGARLSWTYIHKGYEIFACSKHRWKCMAQTGCYVCSTDRLLCLLYRQVVMSALQTGCYVCPTDLP